MNDATTGSGMGAGMSAGAVGVQQLPGGVVVSPAGEVDMSCSPQLRATLKKVQEAKPKRLIVDLGAVTYIDSSGLATLVEAMRTAKAQRTDMLLCGMNDKVRAFFEIARLNQFFRIVATVDAALAV